MATISRRKSPKTGAVTYQVKIRRKGHPAQCRTFSDRAAAKVFARQIEAEADRGTLPNLGKLRRTTVREIAERYRNEICPMLAENATYAVKALLKNKVADLALSEATASAFIEYRDGRLQSVSPATVNRELGTLCRMFNVARREWCYPLENPLQGLSLPNADKPREVRCLPDAETKLMAALLDEDETARDAIRFALATGMRRGEILNARKSHIAWGKIAELHIPETKTGHARTIVLNNTASLILSVRSEAIDGEDGLLFPVTKDQLRRAFGRARKEAGLPSLRFHDLRHERTSRYFEAGLTLPEVGAQTGHKTYRMLMRYAHAQRAMIAEKLKDKPRLMLVRPA